MTNKCKEVSPIQKTLSSTEICPDLQVIPYLRILTNDARYPRVPWGPGYPGGPGGPGPGSHEEVYVSEEVLHPHPHPGHPIRPRPVHPVGPGGSHSHSIEFVDEVR